MFHLIEQIKTLLEGKLTAYDCAVQTAVYENLLVEHLNDSKLVLVLPVRTTWIRVSRGKLMREHTVAVIIISRDGMVMTDYCDNDDLLNELAEYFLIGTEDEADSGGALDDYACKGVTTIDSDELGFFRDSVIKTPSTYIGGLKITFLK
jgi:hypothetical protein